MKYLFSTIVLVLGTVPVGTNIFSWLRIKLVYQNMVESGGAGCVGLIDIPQKLSNECASWLLSCLRNMTNRHPVLFLTRGSVIAADVIVLVLTWVKSVKHTQRMRQLKLGSSIMAVMLRDDNTALGTIYFIVLLVMNILQLLTYSSTLEQGIYLNSFLQTMPPLLVQRFMLNLRQVNPAARGRSSEQSRSRISSIIFRASSDFLGNIGEPLDHGQSERTQDDDDDITQPESPEDQFNEGFAQYIDPSYMRRSGPREAGIIRCQDPPNP
ncbi:uncharacterized protein PHACADRAFT_193899 [Phanerochaete carnosa HHB-10118-sp]|uniref:Uncharacterized protein n=1 Tax=Phanerochaete carnosa (strain HHB-10118-sp) TaxID=650164 RepID=K5WAP4_PHACS|nr:uncharacterized protein PHACADRAFT_193899 [Phanerochaete carnosa HHB-10118-sp]EKM56280.1 hypothetical protein PHACADRAFT_193899 [Phanerochaete carnosa HHB-10118-sp]